MKYIPKYQLRIKLPDGSVRNVAVRGSFTVARVLSEAGVKGKALFKGKELSPGATLEALGIGEGSVLELKV